MISTPCHEQFEETRDKAIARMENDGELLIWLAENWYNESVPCCNILTDEYEITVRKRTG